MVQVNELRIGNWVERENGIWQKISAYDYEHADFEKLQPIVLTSERLVKAGFEKSSVPISSKYYYKKESHKFIFIFVGEDGVYVSFLDKNIQSTAEFFLQVSHLHQLQNLYFALTGEELPINFQ
jgi:penicillin-binding protein-related factor A (putative recombinase)